MRFSRSFIPTLREAPADAEVISHQLMMRAGMIRQVARGIYDYLPLGWRVLKKIIRIAREELDGVGCQEVQLPVVIPAELWQESGRWQQYGKELLRLKDRNDREFCIGPTQEEVITDLVRREVKSYRQLPLNLYQIHTKFRDEIRPRFGLMRGREFLMHDGYSFHASVEDLDRHYDLMRAVYERIFARCGLKCRVVEAATGAIGGKSSHEVMVLAETGESAIAVCNRCGYAANMELATARPSVGSPPSPDAVPSKPREVNTPGLGGVEDVVAVLGVTPAAMIKTGLYLRDGGVVVGLIPGNREINEAKLQAAVGAAFCTMLDAASYRRLAGCEIGFAGPIGMPKEVAGLGAVTVVADTSVMALAVGATGANKTDYHLVGVVPGRDFTPDLVADLAMVMAGEGCPRCKDGTYDMVRGIEVGHIFKLGTKYSAAMKAAYLDEGGKEQPIVMGTYGLGIGRTAAAAIEQHHDEKGIVWPLPIAPFHAVVLLLKANEPTHAAFGTQVYEALNAAGIETLYDDRDERAGVKFADAELIGLPYQLVIGAKGIGQQKVELKKRHGGVSRLCTVAEAVGAIKEALSHAGS
ncbi:MAG: proline--tRNA ligase [Deltaproteobacteria bacterium]|nr:proline--tRNA ligase [Deltaproteobacteria bacterium]